MSTALLVGLLVLSVPGWAQTPPDLNTLRTRATAGDLEAQNALGNAYTNALLGLSQDFAEAFKWYRQAGDKGFAPAQFNLGLSYELGRGVAVDERQAFRFYLMSAEQGFAPAQFNVGNMYASGRGIAQDLFEANLWFKQAAENGLVEAQFNLGLVYETGRGVKKDDALAARWYRTAAERGYARAQYNFALLLEEGRGVPKDTATAALLYRAAAEQGFAPAQVNYGVLLAEGRDGVPRDPVQAYVWLSRAVQNGASPEARDALARSLTPEQLAAAQQAGGARIVSAPAAAAAPAPAQAPAPEAAARLAELTGALAQARDANSRLAEANQRLEVDNARLADELSRAGGSSTLVDQLRAQSSRLAEQVQSLTADKEAGERQTALLTAQVRDAERELAAVRAASAPAVPAVDVSSYENQIATLTRRLDEATTALAQLQAAQADLMTVNQRLQQERDTLAAAGPAAVPPAAGATDANALATLQRDNARLNEEVKRATLELLALNRQLRAQSRAGATGSTSAGGGEEISQLNARVQAAAEEAARLQEENRSLIARVTELENQPRPSVDEALPQKLAESQQAAVMLREQLDALQVEKRSLADQAASLEGKVTELAAAARAAGEGEAGLTRRIDELLAQIKGQEQTLEQQRGEASRLAAENQALTDRLSRAETELRAAAGRKVSSDEVASLRQQLGESQSRLEQLQRDNSRLVTTLTAEQQGAAQALARVAGLERELAAVRSAGTKTDPELERLRSVLTEADRRAEALAATNADLQRRLELAADASGKADELRRQLDEANQALEQSATATAELTAANQRLEGQLADAARTASTSTALQQELAAARQGLAELATLRTDNTRLKDEVARAASQRPQDDQLSRDNASLRTSLADSRRELSQAQDRLTDVEARLAEALTVRTREADSDTRTKAELAEANRVAEKLTGAVAELTAENQKLEEDLANAQKTVAAALAAQSQAVSAASPDAFQMEISTLNARLKQLEAQVEEERTGAAREIATLAGQLQRTRETNRSLTEANRALLSAKESDTSAVRDETESLETRIRELTSVNDELRRQAQQQAADLRATATERDTLRSELADARQVANVLPGLSDEKSALQERLEAVGGDLVALQREHDDLQKTHAEVIQQLAASRQAAEQTGADLAALQARVAAAEQADESHTQSVAELTQTNQRLELEREDMRRLVESYRADIARLTQSVRLAEQQKADAERGGQQNIDALTAQMAQLRREVEAARTGQVRLAEAYAAQERERLATITQLRTENGALAARLNQAQGTLDQIAATARLGTPASTIASGGTPPVRPAPVPADEVRYHTVVEGDSLSRISLRYYGTPNRWQEIFQANRDVLQGSSALRIGMQLRIP